MDGELLAEYPQTGPSVAIAQPTKEYGYRNGQLLVTAEAWDNNLAWNKPATQIDDHAPTTTANKAVDGDTDGALWDSYSSATNNLHANSWWQVDLESVQSISSITVWGRTDCCPDMTSNFYVFVSDNPFNSYDLNTTLAQAGVTSYYYGNYSNPQSASVNRTGRYVRVQLAGTNYLVLGEVQVWSAAANVNWMVTDHLGTPRMVVDKTGSMVGVSRHDYLPFGEEVFAGMGGRSAGQGYTANDGARQQFTQKERDSETGLDYFGARYYGSAQGRFTGPDLAGPDLSSPQSMNKYRYAFNNPCRFIDPNGNYEHDVHLWLTYALAYAAGFSGEQAGIIARANNELDRKGSSTDPEPIGNDTARAMWHFTTTLRRADVWKVFSDDATRGYFDSSLGDLGRYLHTWQDHFSHGTRSPETGQFFDCFRKDGCRGPDKTYVDADKADTMARTTFDKLVKAISIYRGTQRGGPFSDFTAAVSFDSISGLVTQFNKATDLRRKADRLSRPFITATFVPNIGAR